jgi:hypothetical protein
VSFLLQSYFDNSLSAFAQIESGTLEFRDPKLERVVGLTPADRKWIDDLVKDVNEGWDDNDPTRVVGMQLVSYTFFLVDTFSK